MIFREWRKSLGLTQQQIAERMGVSQPLVSEVEADPARASRAFIQKAFEISDGAVSYASWFEPAAVRSGEAA